MHKGNASVPEMDFYLAQNKERHFPYEIKFSKDNASAFAELETI